MEINISKLKTYTQDIKVLYVEDDENIQGQMHRLLSRFFPSITLSQNGKEGLNAYAQDTYDLVISDINMPIMNGIEMIKELNKREEPPIVLVTSAYNDASNLMELINLNISQFIMKPFNPKNFLICLYHLSEKIFYKKEYIAINERLKNSNKLMEEVQDNSSHAIVVIQNNEIESVNSAFLELSGHNDIEDLQNNMPQICMLFEPGFNCIMAQNNKEFLHIMLTEDKSKHIVKTTHTNGQNPIIYSVSICEISKEEDIHLLSFTEITPYLEAYKFDRATKLPNRLYLFDEIENIRHSHEHVYAMALSISHFNEFSIWKGKQEAKDFERLIAEHISAFIKTKKFHTIFLSRYAPNNFLLLSTKPLNDLVPDLCDLKVRPKGLDKEKQKQQKLAFSPLHKLLDFSPELDEDSLDIELINTYDELHY